LIPEKVSFPACVVSQAGRRRANEDAALIRELSIQGKSILIAAVADGMGGHLSGDVASRMAVEGIITHLEKELEGGVEESHVREAICAAYSSINENLLAQGEKDIRLQDMGTTLTALIVIEDHFVISNLGDTRAYRISNEQIEQITEDHSAGAQSLKEGTITEIEAREHRFSGSLIRYLGASEDYPPDIFPEEGFFEIDKGQVLMLCSDGVSGVVDEIDIYEQIIQTESIDRAAHNLIRLAYLKGSKDNMTIILVETKPLPRIKPYLTVPMAMEDKQRAISRSQNNKPKAIFLFMMCIFSLLECDLVFMLFRGLSRESKEANKAPLSLRVAENQLLPTIKPEGDQSAQKPRTSPSELTQKGNELSWNLGPGQAEKVLEFEVCFYEDKDLKRLFLKEKTKQSSVSISDLKKKFDKTKVYYWRVVVFRAGTRIESEAKALVIDREK
jgi:serine/threonine protein phosphatase PrpC